MVMMKKPKEQNPNRTALIALSKQVKAMMKAGQLPQAEKVNDGLVEIYKSQGASDLRTMTEWSEAGLKLKKGCKAKWVWGRPRRDQVQRASEEGQTGEEQLRWFPMAKLFDISDTEEMSEKMAEAVEKKLSKYGRKMRKLKFKEVA